MELARYHVMLLQVSHILLTGRHTQRKKKEMKKDLTYSLCIIILKIWCKKDIYSQHKCDLAITKDCIGELTILYAIKIYVLWKE